MGWQLVGSRMVAPGAGEVAASSYCPENLPTFLGDLSRTFPAIHDGRTPAFGTWLMGIASRDPAGAAGLLSVALLGSNWLPPANWKGAKDSERRNQRRSSGVGTATGATSTADRRLAAPTVTPRSANLSQAAHGRCRSVARDAGRRHECRKSCGSLSSFTEPLLVDLRIQSGTLAYTQRMGDAYPRSSLLLGHRQPKGIAVMARTKTTQPILLQWIEAVRFSGVQDPLGLSGRGTARIARELLPCITSITPRARYYSFIPWAVYDYQHREKSELLRSELNRAVSFREHALALGCIAHHEGSRYPGGSLIGSRKARKWYLAHPDGEVDFRKVKFVKNSALNIYLKPLLNLGVFVTSDEMDTDNEDETQQPENVELTDLGRRLAESYDSHVRSLKAVQQVALPTRRSPVGLLKAWSKHGGLCELAQPSAADRSLLQDMFFCRTRLQGRPELHRRRRDSLLLVIDLCQSLTWAGVAFDHQAFANAVFYREVSSNEEACGLPIPAALDEISRRWQMFYFHYYASVALEAMFSWLVARLYDSGLAGLSLEDLAGRLDESCIRKELAELLGRKLSTSFATASPSSLLGLWGLPTGSLTLGLSKAIDESVRPASPLAETFLEECIYEDQYGQSPTMLAVPLVLFAVTLARYWQWEKTKYGNWLYAIAENPRLDLTPPILLYGLTRHFGDWWNRPWRELTPFILSRYVVRQHQRMADMRIDSGERCLLQSNGSRLTASGRYDKIGISNPRLRSAVQILIDLGLLNRSKLEDGKKEVTLTAEGKRFLKTELAAEQQA